MDSDLDLEENSLLDEYDNSDLPIETCSEDQPQLAVPVTHNIESVHHQGSLNSSHAIPPGLMVNTSNPANCSSMSTTKSRLQSPDSNQEITTSSADVKTSNKKSPSGSLGPVCLESSSVCPVGGSVSINTAHGTRQASGDEVLQMVGAFVTEAEKSDFDFSLEKRDAGHSKEVHVHLTKTDIHQPAAVAFGGQVHVGSPQERSATQNNGETTPLKKLRGE